MQKGFQQAPNIARFRFLKGRCISWERHSHCCFGCDAARMSAGTAWVLVQDKPLESQPKGSAQPATAPYCCPHYQHTRLALLCRASMAAQRQLRQHHSHLAALSAPWLWNVTWDCLGGGRRGKVGSF